MVLRTPGEFKRTRLLSDKQHDRNEQTQDCRNTRAKPPNGFAHDHGHETERDGREKRHPRLEPDSLAPTSLPASATDDRQYRAHLFDLTHQQQCASPETANWLRYGFWADASRRVFMRGTYAQPYPQPSPPGSENDFACVRKTAGAACVSCAGRRPWECPPDPIPGRGAPRLTSTRVSPPCLSTPHELLHQSSTQARRI